MKYRILGKTGLNVSVIGIGTWQLGGEWGKDFTLAEVDSMFEAARQEGINLIDTAECYGDHTSERFIGKAIKKDREKWILATKFGHGFPKPFERIDDFSAKGMVAQLEESLKSLETDYIDVYQAHSPKAKILEDDTLFSELEKQKAMGKIRHIAISIGGFDASQIRRREFSCVQVVYNRLERKAEDTVLPTALEKNMGVLVRVALASGLLSGKYKPGTTWNNNDTRAHRDPDMMQKHICEVMEIQQKEVPQGVDMAQWALAFCLKNKAVTAVIPGCKSAEQVRANAAAANLPDC